MQKFVDDIVAVIQLPYNGLDIAKDKDGKYRLIELNGSPQYARYVADN
ncbi:hypothetical protein KA405_06345 [Patescibacteria group bacterium]|nr:hypothetical protein [Patescibacteria group bacterium]